MNDFTVHAIDPSRLTAMRERRQDESGNALLPYAAQGWEPTRCCLTVAPEGAQIALISYTAFTERSPWAETGPAFIHAEDCGGYTEPDQLPAALRVGPRILRTYREDNTLDYEHITQVGDGEDIEPAIRKLLDEPEVATIHVRPVISQCFLYAVTR